MSTVHHTKLQVNGPSGRWSHLDFHPPPPEVQQPSPVRKIQPHSPVTINPQLKPSHKKEKNQGLGLRADIKLT